MPWLRLRLRKHGLWLWNHHCCCLWLWNHLRLWLWNNSRREPLRRQVRLLRHTGRLWNHFRLWLWIQHRFCLRLRIHLRLWLWNHHSCRLRLRNCLRLWLRNNSCCLRLWNHLWLWLWLWLRSGLWCYLQVHGTNVLRQGSDEARSSAHCPSESLAVQWFPRQHYH